MSERNRALTPESETLRAIDRLLRSVPGARSETLALKTLLLREADALRAAHRAGRPETAYLVRGKYRGRPDQPTDDEVLATTLTAEQAWAAMVRWHWFASEAAFIPHADQPVDPRFEAACDAIVDGDAAALETLLAADPALVHARSRFAHHQTLLQHVSANGIENSRQWQSPANAVAIAERLLDAGAEPDVPCDSYGGSTAMTLLVTSAHPAAAGVQADLVALLCRRGAHPDGPRGDGSPLWQAIASWYPRAVDALVAAGARVDNLLFAAAAGDLEGVASHFDDRGVPIAPAAHDPGRATVLVRPGLEARHFPEYALHWAIAHHRRPVVAFLLAQRLDLGVKEPTWNNTLAETVSFANDADIAALVQAALDRAGGARP